MKAMHLLCAAVCLMFVSASAHGVVPGQTDTFEIADDTLGWGGSKGTISPEPVQVPDGGPAGAGDGYLEKSSFRYHLAVRNQTTWAGDYVAAGVQRIRMDVLPERDPNDVSPVLSLRIAVDGPGGFFSTATPVEVVSGTGWQPVEFGLSPADLVYVTGGTGQLVDTLSAVTTLLFRHDSDPSPSPPGTHPEHITATIGIDNIEAVALAAEPPADGTLPKTMNNVMLLSFPVAISLPVGSPLVVTELGDPNVDVSASFDYQLDPNDASTLKATELGGQLVNQTWYHVRSAAAWQDVAPFVLDVCTLWGDCNNSGRVTTADYSCVKAALGDRGDGRADLNGSARVTTADYSVVKSYLGGRVPAKP
jgi:hypothetical protein